MANLADDAKLQVKESLISGPQDRLPPDGMEMIATKCTNDVETDAVPSTEDVQRSLAIRDGLGISQDMPEKTAEEDARAEDKAAAAAELLNSSQRETDLGSDPGQAVGPNEANRPEPQHREEPSAESPEGRVARADNGNVTPPSDRRSGASNMNDACPDTGYIDLADVHISDPAEPTGGANSQSAASAKKQTLAAVFSARKPTAAPGTRARETNAPTSERSGRAHVSTAVSPVSRDIGEVVTAAQPDAQLDTAAAAAAALLSPPPSLQTANVMATSPHSPTQETASSGASAEEYFDVLLLHSDHDTDHVETFMAFANDSSWKVTSLDDFSASVPKLSAFSTAFEHSSYTVLLLTGDFHRDCWCERRYQTALVESIENPDKQCCVIPVICDDQFKMPMELNVLTGVKLNAPNCKRVLAKTIDVNKRKQRESAAAANTQQAILEVQATTSSLDELYNRRRPELNPGLAALRVFRSDDAFRQLCVALDKEHPLGNDWRMVAERLGFQAVSIRSLARDKSPAAQVLDCFCQSKTEQGMSVQEILDILRQMLLDIQRNDVAEIMSSVGTGL